MWSVSERFLDAIRGPHKTLTVLTVTPPGGDAVSLDVKAASYSVDGSSRTRRTANLVVFGDAATFALVSTPGAVFRLSYGILFGNSSEIVPVLTGEATVLSQDFADGTVKFSLADFGSWLARNRFITPYQPSAGSSRVDVIEDVVSSAGITGLGPVVNVSSDVGVLGGGRLWESDRWDVISDLTTDGVTQAYFTPDGGFVIADAPTSDDVPVWTVNSGTSGVLKSATRDRPLDRLYNTVVVRPSSTEGDQGWGQQVVQLSGGDRDPARIGVVPYFWNSPTVSTAAGALAAGRRILDRVTGTAETLLVTAVANVALEANDVIRVVTPQMNLDPPLIFRHFVDSFSVNLMDGSMSINTRGMGVEV